MGLIVCFVILVQVILCFVCVDLFRLTQGFAVGFVCYGVLCVFIDWVFRG